MRINGKTVIDASWTLNQYSSWSRDARTVREDAENPQDPFKINKPGISGDWFTLREGSEVEIDIALGEVPGGWFGAYLLIEEKGVEGYKIFSTLPLSDQDKDFLRRLHPKCAQFL